MKTLFFLPIVALAVACGTAKETRNSDPIVVEEVIEEDTPQIEEPPVDPVNRVLGTVHLNEGCGVYIEVVTDEGMQLFYPVNLDEVFKVEGARIKFEYALSRAMQPKGCSVDATVTVSDVTRMRD